MEYGSIERELHIDASPEVVFDVISSPEHIRDWWSAETDIEPRAGSSSELTWRDERGGTAKVVPIIVVEAEPPHLFKFRWTQPPGEQPTPANSLLVTFGPSVHRDRLPRAGLGHRGARAGLPRARQGLGFVPAPHRGSRRSRDAGTVMIAIDDDLWSAVGDPTRRRMLDLLLTDSGGTATSLSEQLPVTRQAVAKHLGVLDRVGLVHATPSGRERRYRADDAQLARAVAQLASVGATWDARLRRIARIAEAIQRSQEG
jgi:uncharacterized protein YndB with AHSA1/START domain/DNA-binding transcriptional ArsR family regulator